jgi:glyoxylase-like metal-dependent hydrolase (beta-lactamase superfamily II)
MAEVKILISGYAKPTGHETFKASPSTVLINDSGKLILVDPGANEKKLIEALEKEGLKPVDIDIIFLTHYHLDHLLNIRLFPDKDIYDSGTIYRGDEELEFFGKIPGTDVAVIETPGHAHEHASLLVNTTEGVMCVAGDLWWWQDNEKQITDKKSLLNLKDPFVKDKKALLESRKKILKMADFVIPGHGKMFKIDR